MNQERTAVPDNDPTNQPTSQTMGAFVLWSFYNRITFCHSFHNRITGVYGKTHQKNCNHHWITTFRLIFHARSLETEHGQIKKAIIQVETICGKKLKFLPLIDCRKMIAMNKIRLYYVIRKYERVRVKYRVIIFEPFSRTPYGVSMATKMIQRKWSVLFIRLLICYDCYLVFPSMFVIVCHDLLWPQTNAP